MTSNRNPKKLYAVLNVQFSGHTLQLWLQYTLTHEEEPWLLLCVPLRCGKH